MLSVADTCAIVSAVFSVLAFAVALAALVFAATTYKKSIERERMQATLSAFPQLRKDNGNLLTKLSEITDAAEREETLKDYLSQLERFAVGINSGAYDIKIINRMSGGMLVNQYEKCTREFIAHRRRDVPHAETTKSSIYCEYEEMMKELYALRGKKWEA